MNQNARDIWKAVLIFVPVLLFIPLGYTLKYLNLKGTIPSHSAALDFFVPMAIYFFCLWLYAQKLIREGRPGADQLRTHLTSLAPSFWIIVLWFTNLFCLGVSVGGLLVWYVVILLIGMFAMYKYKKSTVRLRELTGQETFVPLNNRLPGPGVFKVAVVLFVVLNSLIILNIGWAASHGRNFFKENREWSDEYWRTHTPPGKQFP